MPDLRFSACLERTSAEIRFKPKLNSWDNAVPLARVVEDDFENWRINQGKKSGVVLFTEKTRRTLKVAYDSIIFISEQENAAQDLPKIVKRLNEKFEENGVESYIHIGARRVFIYKSEVTYSELTQIFYEKFYANQDKIAELSGEEIRDVAFILDGKSNDFNNHVQIGPVNREEAIVRFNSIFEIDSNNLSKENGLLYFDVDIYKSEPDIASLRDAGALVSKLDEESNRVLKGYLEFISKS